MYVNDRNFVSNDERMAIARSVLKLLQAALAARRKLGNQRKPEEPDIPPTHGAAFRSSSGPVKISIGDAMAELDKGKPVSLEELMLATLAQTDALTKLLLEKGIITDAELKQKLVEERRYISAF